MSEFDPNVIYQKLIEAGEAWADKDAAASLLEETKSSIFSQLFNEAEASSVAAREAIAKADPVYRLHIANMVEARRQATICKVRYDAQKILGELRRTEQSNRRAEMNIR